MAGDLRELATLDQLRGQRRDGASRLLRAAWAEIARLQEEAIARESRLAEVEGLLAAERERCAKVALTVYEWSPTWTGKLHEVIAAAIRSLPSEPMGGE